MDWVFLIEISMSVAEFQIDSQNCIKTATKASRMLLEGCVDALCYHSNDKTFVYLCEYTVNPLQTQLMSHGGMYGSPIYLRCGKKL